MKLNKVYIEITNHCNLSCSFCMPSNKVKKEMSVDEFAHIIEVIKPLTKSIYLHVKGEPLLHSQLFALLDICEKQQMRVNITSNGTLLKHLHIQLSEYTCIKKMNISLHCENKQPHYLDDVMTSVDVLSKKTTIIYRLWTLDEHVLDDASMHIVNQLEQYYQLSKEVVQALHTQNNVNIANNIYVDKDNEFKWPTLEHKDLSEGYCYALKTHFAILVDGSVVPCCLDGEGVITLGNIFTQDIHEIIKGERYQNLKKSFQDRKPCELLCQKCTFKLRFSGINTNTNFTRR